MLSVLIAESQEDLPVSKEHPLRLNRRGNAFARDAEGRYQKD
jgi:hypothetical protein